MTPNVRNQDHDVVKQNLSPFYGLFRFFCRTGSSKPLRYSASVYDGNEVISIMLLFPYPPQTLLYIIVVLFSSRECISCLSCVFRRKVRYKTTELQNNPQILTHTYIYTYKLPLILSISLYCPTSSPLSPILSHSLPLSLLLSSCHCLSSSFSPTLTHSLLLSHSPYLALSYSLSHTLFLTLFLSPSPSLTLSLSLVHSLTHSFSLTISITLSHVPFLSRSLACVHIRTPSCLSNFLRLFHVLLKHLSK